MPSALLYAMEMFVALTGNEAVKTSREGED